MATDELTCPVTCPQCDEPIPMPTSVRLRGQSEAQVTLDTSAVCAHFANHSVYVESATAPGPAEQIISDPGMYPGICADEQRHAELLGWLRANGIEPNDIPIDSTISIAKTNPEGGLVIRHTVFLRNDAGRHYVPEGSADAAREDRATLLTVPLPDGWPQPVGPIRASAALREATP